jgi:nucleoside-diphosphate-sugar epimerase
VESVLVTGGAGFVGRNLTRELIIQGFNVTCVDSIIEGGGGEHPKFWKDGVTIQNEFEFIQEDCRKFFGRQRKFDHCFHLAAVVGGRVSIEKSPLLVAQDLSIDSAFWDYSINNVLQKAVYFSSSAAYPIYRQKSSESISVLQESEIDFEEHIGMPDLTYGWSKLTGEYLARIYGSVYRKPYVVYRPFSGYGIEQSLSYPIPALIDRAKNLKSNDKFEVWGSGMQIRDFIHISDVINKIMLSFNSRSENLTMNLSTGLGYNFKEIAKIILNLLEKSNPIISLESKPSGVQSRVGSIKLQEKMGLKNNLTVEMGIKKFIDGMI